MLPEQLGHVVRLLARLPGVGDKTAQRYALFLATGDERIARDLARALVAMRDRLLPCARCGHIAERTGDSTSDVGSDGPAQVLCRICSDPRRDPGLLCVVARVQDLLAIERSGAMRGRYFVLGRLLSPLEGVGAEDLPLAQLRAIVGGTLSAGDVPVSEVLCATPPSVEGEATALLLSRELEPMGCKVTRIASGVPHGGDLELADQITLGRAIEGRRQLG